MKEYYPKEKGEEVHWKYYISENGHWVRICTDNINIKIQGKDAWRGVLNLSTASEYDYLQYDMEFSIGHSGSVPGLLILSRSHSYLRESVDSKRFRSNLKIGNMHMRLFPIGYLFRFMLLRNKILKKMHEKKEFQDVKVSCEDTCLTIEAESEPQAEQYAELLREMLDIQQGIIVSELTAQYDGSSSYSVQLDFNAVPQDEPEIDIDLEEPYKQEYAPIVRKKLLVTLYQEHNDEVPFDFGDNYKEPVMRLVDIVIEHAESMGKWYRWNGFQKKIFC